MNILEKINNFNVNINNQIDIVYSILVHENIDCIMDMIYNICYFRLFCKIKNIVKIKILIKKDVARLLLYCF